MFFKSLKDSGFKLIQPLFRFAMARSGTYFRIKQLESQISFFSDIVFNGKTNEILYFLDQHLGDKNFKVPEPIRIGSKHDGGYVLDRITNEDTLISLGIGKNAEFERDCHQYVKNGIAYDGTIVSLPKEFPADYRWNPMNVEGVWQSANCIGINDVFSKFSQIESTNFLLKIDVEGSEYEIVEAILEKNIMSCTQIVMEVHDFLRNLFFNLEKVRKFFEKLELTHDLVLIHGNNYDFHLNIGDWCVPNAIELTWKRKDIKAVTPTIESERRNMELCTPNNRYLEDITLKNRVFDNIL